jgi:hypothetical protein
MGAYRPHCSNIIWWRTFVNIDCTRGQTPQPRYRKGIDTVRSTISHMGERDLTHSTHAVLAACEYTTYTLSLVDLYLTLITLINNPDCVRTSHLDRFLYWQWVVGIVLVMKTVVVEGRET